MRIAELVNHQTVERILHFFKREVSLFECVLTPLVSRFLLATAKLWGDADFEVYSRVCNNNASALKNIHVELHTNCIQLLACTPLLGVDQQKRVRDVV